MDGFHKDKYRGVDNKCIALGKFWINGAESSDIVLSENTIDCEIFDIIKLECTKCKANHYLSKKKCCDFGKVNVNGVCVSISITFSINNCD